MILNDEMVACGIPASDYISARRVSYVSAAPRVAFHVVVSFFEHRKIHIILVPLQSISNFPAYDGGMDLNMPYSLHRRTGFSGQRVLRPKYCTGHHVMHH